MQTITILSPTHGARIWTRVGRRPYVRRDGTPTTLAVWQCHCAICGGPFAVTTPEAVQTAEQAAAFKIVTCPAHRLTPFEILRMRNARAADRPAVFAKIREKRIRAATFRLPE
jgi:hypothetical protein